MTKRKGAIIRVKRYKLASVPNYHLHLMMYYPWHEEEELKGDYLIYESSLQRS